MMGGSSVLSSAALKSSETSASCGGEDASLTPTSLLPLRMMERLGGWVVEDGTEDSKRAFELCEEELAVLLLLLGGSMVDRERSRDCLDWRNFGNLDEEGDEELRDLEDIRIMMSREKKEKVGGCALSAALLVAVLSWPVQSRNGVAKLVSAKSRSLAQIHTHHLLFLFFSSPCTEKKE